MSERFPTAAGDLPEEDNLEEGVERLVGSIQARASELADREGRVHELERLLEAQRGRVERLEERLLTSEAELVERTRLLDERERGLDVREAQLEAEEELRLGKLERSEAFVAEVQQRLEAREGQFAVQIGQLQQELRRRDVGAVAARAAAQRPATASQ